MSRLRIRIELNRGGVGVPLNKLASVVHEAQSFFRMLGDDVHIDQSQGDWLGFDFDHESLNFTAEFVGPVTQEQVAEFHAAFDGTTPLRRATIAQFARIADGIEEDEVIGFGLYLNESEDPGEWRCLSRRDALRIAEEIQVLLGAGQVGQDSHLPAVADAGANARYMFGRRGVETAKLAGAVKEVEANLSKRISRLEGEVAEHSGHILDLRSKSVEAEQSMGRLLTAVEGFCEQAALRLETATNIPVLSAAAAAPARAPIGALSEAQIPTVQPPAAQTSPEAEALSNVAAQSLAEAPVPSPVEASSSTTISSPPVTSTTAASTTSKEESSKPLTGQDTTPKDTAFTDSAPKAVVGKDLPAKDIVKEALTPTLASPAVAAATTGTAAAVAMAKDVAPKDVVSKDATPKDATLKDIVAKEPIRPMTGVPATPAAVANLLTSAASSPLRTATPVMTAAPFKEHAPAIWWRSPVVIVVGVGTIVILLGILLWPSGSSTSGSSSPVTQASEPAHTAAVATAPTPVSEPAAATPEPSASPAAATAKPVAAPIAKVEGTPAATTSTAAAPGEGITRVELEATEASWISIRAGDGTTQLITRVIEPGKPQTLDIREPSVLRAGNAGGLTIRANGKLLGPLGPHGAVRDVEFKGGDFKLIPLQ